MKRQYLARVAPAALAIAILAANGSASAQSVSDATVKALMARIEQLEREVNELKKGQAQSDAEAKSALKQANQARAQAAQATQATQTHVAKAGTEEIDKEGHRFLEHKKGTALTFYTPGGEITGYGNFDVSFDYASKNVRDQLCRRKSGLVRLLYSPMAYGGLC